MEAQQDGPPQFRRSEDRLPKGAASCPNVTGHQHGGPRAAETLEALAHRKGYFRWTVSHSTPRSADVILEELGGSRFLTMTGASHLVADNRALHLRLPRNASGANRLSIELDKSTDTYRWSRRGADLLLQVRCAVYNGALGSGLGHLFEPISHPHPPLAKAA